MGRREEGRRGGRWEQGGGMREEGGGESGGERNMRKYL